LTIELALDRICGRTVDFRTICNRTRLQPHWAARVDGIGLAHQDVEDFAWAESE
jgi:hypothetical protein